MQNEYHWGPVDAPVAFIAEAPSDNELTKHEPLVGPSGSIFDICLESAQLWRKQVYIGNVCRTQISSGSALVRRKKVKGVDTIIGWTEKGEEECQNFIQRIQATTSRVFVPMGNIALYALTGQSSISKYRGSVLQCTIPGLEDRKVVPTYHPAATLRGKSLWKYDIVLDMRRAKKESEREGIPGLGGTLLSHSTFDECMDFLWLCHRNKIFAHDIEVYNGHISCMSFAVRYQGEVNAICIPFYDANASGRARWTSEQEMELWALIATILQDPSMTCIGQNYIFDMSVLTLRNGILPTCKIEDTMIAHSIMYPDTPKGLDYLCSVYTDIPYYKEDRKLWNKLDEAQDRFWEYSAKDALATLLVWEALVDDLQNDPLHMQTYRGTVDLYPLLMYIQQGGIAVDMERLELLRVEVEQEYDTKCQELNEVADYEFNPGSPKQCAEYFYGHKGLRPYTAGKTGNPTTDDDALRRLIIRDNLREARIVQECRGLRKFAGTLNMAIDPDNRMRCSTNPRGTKFGRISTSKTIFGTGGNMQNLDTKFKVLLSADADSAFFEFDEEGAEWVIVARLADDPRMIEVAEGDESPHTITAHYAFGVDKEVIKNEDKLLGHLTDPVIIKRMREEHFPILLQPNQFIPSNMTLRQGGKRANHGLNYDFGYKSFAIKYDMPERDGKRIHSLYRRIYAIEDYHRDVVHQLRRNHKTLINCFGRKYHFLGNMNDELFKQGYSFEPQSTAADLMNRGLKRIWNDTQLERWRLNIQVHDSGLFQHPIPVNEPVWIAWHRWLRIAKDIKQMIAHMTEPLTCKGHTFTIPIGLKVSGTNWAHMQEINVRGSVEDIAGQLRDTLHGTEAK